MNILYNSNKIRISNNIKKINELCYMQYQRQVAGALRVHTYITCITGKAIEPIMLS